MMFRKNNQISRLLERISYAAVFMCYGTLLSVLMGCQAAQPTTTPAMPTATVAAANTTLAASTEEPMPDRVETAVPRSPFPVLR
ncbi:MAG: hypothetical protein R6X34_29475 [Chloroflexota bacterium]